MAEIKGSREVQRYKIFDRNIVQNGRRPFLKGIFIGSLDRKAIHHTGKRVWEVGLRFKIVSTGQRQQSTAGKLSYHK